jgi:hypothetical protein
MSEGLAALARRSLTKAGALRLVLSGAEWIDIFVEAKYRGRLPAT